MKHKQFAPCNNTKQLFAFTRYRFGSLIIWSTYREILLRFYDRNDRIVFSTVPDGANLSLSLQREVLEGRIDCTLMSADAFCKPFVSDLVVTFGDLPVTPLPSSSSQQHELILEFRLTTLYNVQCRVHSRATQFAWMQAVGSNRPSADNTISSRIFKFLSYSSTFDVPPVWRTAESGNEFTAERDGKEETGLEPMEIFIPEIFFGITAWFLAFI
ncbi:hypothetical protein ALC62_14634 [Cyphomyrmex costatus]|uniref:Uncharacterized protein n=1 Tax=Cyphomyrmex costatus TaxID=456900 RepID=A0A195C1A0_9HYME|nr:hypothetical protein ALC62_14634 [Cyphomyrmex costatus]